ADPGPSREELSESPRSPGDAGRSREGWLRSGGMGSAGSAREREAVDRLLEFSGVRIEGARKGGVGPVEPGGARLEQGVIDHDVGAVEVGADRRAQRLALGDGGVVLALTHARAAFGVELTGRLFDDLPLRVVDALVIGEVLEIAVAVVLPFAVDLNDRGI